MRIISYNIGINKWNLDINDIFDNYVVKNKLNNLQLFELFDYIARTATANIRYINSIENFPCVGMLPVGNKILRGYLTRLIDDYAETDAIIINDTPYNLTHDIFHDRNNCINISKLDCPEINRALLGKLSGLRKSNVISCVPNIFCHTMDDLKYTAYNYSNKIDMNDPIYDNNLSAHYIQSVKIINGPTEYIILNIHLVTFNKKYILDDILERVRYISDYAVKSGYTLIIISNLNNLNNINIFDKVSKTIIPRVIKKYKDPVNRDTRYLIMTERKVGDGCICVHDRNTYYTSIHFTKSINPFSTHYIIGTDINRNSDFDPSIMHPASVALINHTSYDPRSTYPHPASIRN